MESQQQILGMAKFVVNYYKRDLLQTIAALVNLKELYSNQGELEIRLFYSMGIKFDLIHTNPALEDLNSNHQFMKEVLYSGEFNAISAQFFDGYYRCMIDRRYGEPDMSLLTNTLALDSICPPLMRKDYLMFIISVAGMAGEVDALTDALTEYETLE